ncbi:hypothetical protein BV22DRAFT_1050884 [Leucogyrophana mollusca]|uniref:Uncharacterized protein n=1 Tax=Leucogyrophana mollusca TaxID=85980 RepID=A0ACB8B1N8_9AGAM|nr:hypothetical protein BV22DRAFT_1050884 [Leucogyrophana mollusca]
MSLPHAEKYWKMGLSDIQITELLQNHYDQSLYGLSVSTFKRWRKDSWGWLSTRQQQHDNTTIAVSVEEIQSWFPKVGARSMVNILRQDYGKNIPEKVVLDHLRAIEPAAVQSHKAKHFKRKRFWAAGLPLVTQSDPGSENYSVANCQPLCTIDLTHPSLILFNIGGCTTKFTPGFEDILDKGLNNGLYDPDDPLEKLVFLWLAIPWLQKELDAWVHRFNTTKRHTDTKKTLPCGIPELIRTLPERYGTLDLKVHVPEELLEEMENQWVPAAHPVFKLVPSIFDEQARLLYGAIGAPEVSSATFWDVYQDLLFVFQSRRAELPFDTLLEPYSVPNNDNNIALLSGLKNLCYGENVLGNYGYEYMGGLADPPVQEWHWGGVGQKV